MTDPDSPLRSAAQAFLEAAYLYPDLMDDAVIALRRALAADPAPSSEGETVEARYDGDDPELTTGENVLAAWLHGDQCTCPFAIEDADRERAAAAVAMLRYHGFEIAALRPASPGAKGELSGIWSTTSNVTQEQYAADRPYLQLAAREGRPEVMIEGRRYVFQAIDPEGPITTPSGQCQFTFGRSDGTKCHAQPGHPIHHGEADGPDPAHAFQPEHYKPRTMLDHFEDVSGLPERDE